MIFRTVKPRPSVPEAAPVDLLRGLAVIAEPPMPEHALIAKALGLPSAPTSSEYSDLFLFQLYPYASVHLGEEGMMGGEAQSRVGGFWRAIGHSPPAEPDHLAALLGLYAGLCDDGSWSAAEAALLLEGRRTLLWEHLAPWIFAFLGRVQEIGPSPYREWASLLSDVLTTEVQRLDRPSEVVPAPLAATPAIADPRAEGTDAFLRSLLAPIRSGVLITRVDLALMARASDVGLRAGERRYALEHLLAQDARPILTALAAEAERQAAVHSARHHDLGELADFLAGRAGGTADLLRALAADAVSPTPAGVAE